MHLVKDHGSSQQATRFRTNLSNAWSTTIEACFLCVCKALLWDYGHSVTWAIFNRSLIFQVGGVCDLTSLADTATLWTMLRDRNWPLTAQHVRKQKLQKHHLQQPKRRMKANSTHVGKCESKGYVLFWWPLTGSSKSKHYTPIVRIAYGSMMISMVHPFPNQPNQIGYIQVLSPENFMISPWNHYIHWINSLRLKLPVWKPTKTIKSHHNPIINSWGPNLSQRGAQIYLNAEEWPERTQSASLWRPSLPTRLWWHRAQLGAGAQGTTQGDGTGMFPNGRPGKGWMVKISDEQKGGSWLNGSQMSIQLGLVFSARNDILTLRSS